VTEKKYIFLNLKSRNISFGTYLLLFHIHVSEKLHPEH